MCLRALWIKHLQCLYTCSLFWTIWWGFGALGPQRHDWTHHHSAQYGAFLIPSWPPQTVAWKVQLNISSIHPQCVYTCSLMCSNLLWSSHQKHDNARWSTDWLINNTKSLCHAKKLQLATILQTQHRKKIHLLTLISVWPALFHGNRVKQHRRYVFPLNHQ